jgi:transposase-like protein
LKLSSQAAPSTTFERSSQEYRKRACATSIEEAGRISAAAADLGIGQSTLYELMEKPGISRK